MPERENLVLKIKLIKELFQWHFQRKTLLKKLTPLKLKW